MDQDKENPLPDSMVWHDDLEELLGNIPTGPLLNVGLPNSTLQESIGNRPNHLPLEAFRVPSTELETIVEGLSMTSPLRGISIQVSPGSTGLSMDYFGGLPPGVYNVRNLQGLSGVMELPHEFIPSEDVLGSNVGSVAGGGSGIVARVEEEEEVDGEKEEKLERRRSKSTDLETRRSKSTDKKKKSKNTPKCEICGQTFARVDHLKRHSLIHSGERNYECDVCKKRFARSDDLVRHQKTHFQG